MITHLTLADELTNFIKQFKPHSTRIEVLRAILKHIEFETIFYMRDKQGMAGCVRFNILGETAHILDVFIRKDCERKGLMKYLAKEGWSRWPFVKFFTFERLKKYPYRKQRVYTLAQLLKEK